MGVVQIGLYLYACSTWSTLCMMVQRNVTAETIDLYKLSYEHADAKRCLSWIHHHRLVRQVYVALLYAYSRPPTHYMCTFRLIHLRWLWVVGGFSRIKVVSLKMAKMKVAKLNRKYNTHTLIQDIRRGISWQRTRNVLMYLYGSLEIFKVIAWLRLVVGEVDCGFVFSQLGMYV